MVRLSFSPVLFGDIVRTSFQQFEKGLARILQLLFQPRGAVAIAAGPGLGAIHVAAFAAVVSVLHLHEVEILLPVRTLFLERRGALADFDPSHRLVGTNPRLVHVAQIFVPGD